MSGDDLSDTGRFRLAQWSRRLADTGRRAQGRRRADRIRGFLGSWGALIAWVLTIMQLLGVDLHGWIGGALQ